MQTEQKSERFGGLLAWMTLLTFSLAACGFLPDDSEACHELEEISQLAFESMEAAGKSLKGDELRGGEPTSSDLVRNSHALELVRLGRDISEIEIRDEFLSESAAEMRRGLIRLGRSLDARNTANVDVDGVEIGIENVTIGSTFVTGHCESKYG